MKISATVRNAQGSHEATVSTAGAAQSLQVAPKRDGAGSSVNGGEFLMLALATCYCNDLYREAARLGVPLNAVEVRARGEFAGRGLSAQDICYAAWIDSPASPEAIERLLRETDAVAEVHNTIRAGVPVERERWTDSAGRVAG
ncbi:MAG TPA: OsmC family protein [Telluria sp.]|nr:OsmC family protein [Telluria sp.]